MNFFLTLLFLSTAAACQQANDGVPAFPSAEGFGKYTTGGRAGVVYIVTNLNDNGPGSLRAGVAMKDTRTIVFQVSGTIALESPLNINSGNITIAGHSAPGDGICLRNFPLIINADNVIIRYMRFRLGDEKAQEADAISGVRRKNIIVDHCSMSWATDECASFYDNENFTLQWCIISESLNQSVHQKGEHGYGGIWGGMGASFHHNLLASHTSRNPRFCGSRYHHHPERELVDFRNNVIYNWKDNSAYAGERGSHNMIGNYYKPGPATGKSKRKVLINPYQPYGLFFLSGNVMEGDAGITANNFLGVKCDHPDSVKVNDAFITPYGKEQPAAEAYEAVVEHAGASLHRDAADQRVIAEVRTGKSASGKTGNGIIDSQKDVGGWPELRQTNAPPDADKDGMADTWEKSNGLDPADPSDHAVKSLSRQYTNLEVYLESFLPH